MLRKLPGIDIPAATEASILHAAAFLDFKQHVVRLAREGHDLAAYTCWMHAVEIRHSRFVIPTTSESELFESFGQDALLQERMPALRSTPWRVQVPLVGAVEQLRRHHSARCAPGHAWNYYYEHQEKMDLLLLGLRLYNGCGDAGQLGMGELFETWRTWEQSFPERGFLATFVDPLKRVRPTCNHPHRSLELDPNIIVTEALQMQQEEDAVQYAPASEDLPAEVSAQARATKKMVIPEDSASDSSEGSGDSEEGIFKLLSRARRKQPGKGLLSEGREQKATAKKGKRVRGGRCQRVKPRGDELGGRREVERCGKSSEGFQSGDQRNRCERTL